MQLSNRWHSRATGAVTPVFASAMASLVALALGVSASAPAQPVTPRIPDRIADSTFWRMITEFSEPDGAFMSENFVSNENEWQRVIPHLLTRVARGGVYLGVGPEQNFTYIAALEPRIAFICDIRRQNLVQHLMYKALFELSADRADMLSRLWARPRPTGLDGGATPAALLMAFDSVRVDTVYRNATLAAMFESLVVRHGFALSGSDSSTLRHVYGVFVEAGPDVNYSSRAGRAALTLPLYSVRLRDSAGVVVTLDSTRVRYATRYSLTSGALYASLRSLMLEDDGAGVNRGWLADDRAFRWMKDFQERNLLVPVVGNFAGPKALRAIGEYVRAHRANVTTFYVSNVEQYLFQSLTDWRNFYGNVAALPLDSTATFIRSTSANYGYLRPQKAGSRMAQMTALVREVLSAFTAGTLMTYPGLIEIRDR